MAKRANLSKVLHDIIGNNNVYFQPPASKKMNYPCIVYEQRRLNTQYADNRPYKIDNVYIVTYIDRNPDSDIPEKIAMLPQTIFERSYISDNLYHNSFRITL